MYSPSQSSPDTSPPSPSQLRAHEGELYCDRTNKFTVVQMSARYCPLCGKPLACAKNPMSTEESTSHIEDPPTKAGSDSTSAPGTRIASRLARLELGLQQLNSRLRSLEGSLERLDSLLLGDPSDSPPTSPPGQGVSSGYSEHRPTGRYAREDTNDGVLPSTDDLIPPGLR